MHSNVSSIITGEFDGYLLGDRGYPCQPSQLTPYPEPGPQRFNVAHCRTRAWVETTIGILKSRFQCLQKLRITPERACDIIVACVVLHNIAIIRGEQHPAVQIGPKCREEAAEAGGMNLNNVFNILQRKTNRNKRRHSKKGWLNPKRKTNTKTNRGDPERQDTGTGKEQAGTHAGRHMQGRRHADEPTKTELKTGLKYTQN